MTYAYYPPPPPYRRPRRPRRFRPLRWLLGLLAVGLVLVLGVFGLVAWAWSSAGVDTVGRVEFEQRLRIPPLARSHTDGQGRRVFDLTAQEGTTELRPGTRTDTWGFNGSYLGPTLRAERGEQVALRVTNDLEESTSVHWHGMHLPARMDGGPHQQVAPGDTWTPHWRVDQPASTLWYHPHPHGDTEQHVYRGLAGMFILDDPDSRVADRLPHEYGVDDIPVIVQDKDFDDDGELREGGSSLGGTGLLGDTLLVNGTYGPYLDVTTTRVRLRLLNASTARVYDFGFSDDREFAVIGSDGGLLPAAVRQDRITLSPGERAEVVVAMRPGAQVDLRSYPPDVGAGLLGRFAGGSDAFDVLQLRAADRLAPSPALPETLAPAPDLDVDEDGLQEVDRRFELSGRSINGTQMVMSRIDESVELGSTEVWEVHNRDGMHHNFHVHDVQFQVLSVDGAAPPADYGGWKDTIYLRPSTTMLIAMRFSDYADARTPYMFHCHLLAHEDSGMMGQFAVVRPGQEAGTVGHRHH
jgi:FtsP/CotA-like multicopper oxidase with cupredoxin domain